MQSAVGTFGQWLSGTGAQLYVIIEDADRQTTTDPNLDNLQKLYRDADIQATFVPPPPRHSSITATAAADSSSDSSRSRKHTVDQLHFILVRSLLSFSQTENEPGLTKWLAIIDDDTFITSLHALESRILSKFDPAKPHWIGVLSDDFSSVNLWGFMAFGGAGVFLSLPLASQIEPHVETCIARSRIQSGDGILKECIYRYTRTKLTIVEGLYQHDMRGDLSGFYESGVNPVSVHHWKSWYRDPIPRMVEISKVCGGCWLQRWKFRGAVGATVDGGERGPRQEEGINDMLLANGYSITEYYPVDGSSSKNTDEEDDTWGDLDDDPDSELEMAKNQIAEDNEKRGPGGLDNIDLGRIEGTWSHPTSEFDPSYGPLRRKLGLARKKSYKLIDVNIVAAGGVGYGDLNVLDNDRRTMSGGGNENEERVDEMMSKKKEDSSMKQKEVQLKEVRQVYVHRRSDAWQPEEGAMDEVIELIWEV